MKHQSSPRLSPGVLLVTALATVVACSKRTSPPTPGASASVPGSGDKQSGEPGSLPPGIDLSKLDEFKRKVFDQVVNREPSACGKGHSLLHSVTHDRSCRASFYAVRYIARLAGAGSSETEISVKLADRYHAPPVPAIDLSQAPSKGAQSGRLTMVEFADYECTHCKEAQEVIHPLLAAYPKDITFYFKHFPLGGHVNALNAALGAAGAQKQGKFWEFSDKVWENSDRLTPALLESIAKEIGLDFPRWYSDLGTPEVRSHVQQDRTEARSLTIQRTPAIFINGRRYTDEIDLVSLKDWVDEALGR